LAGAQQESSYITGSILDLPAENGREVVMETKVSSHNC